MSLDSQKVTVTLPKGLLERLNENVPSRKRSLFITEAIEEHLDLLEQISVLQETAGSWTLEKHPTLQNDKDIDKWLEESRRSWG